MWALSTAPSSRRQTVPAEQNKKKFQPLTCHKPLQGVPAEQNLSNVSGSRLAVKRARYKRYKPQAIHLSHRRRLMENLTGFRWSFYFIQNGFEKEDDGDYNEAGG